jgi:hypothetical protein
MRQHISKTNHGKVTRNLLNVYVKEKTAKTLNEGTYVLVSLPGNICMLYNREVVCASVKPLLST